MKTLILHHDDCLRHDTGRRHVEAPARITAVLNGVKNLPGTEILPAPRASFEQLRLAHAPEYWERLVELEPTLGSGENQGALDPDTFLSAGSIDATLRASGAACFAIDQIFAGKAKNAFCATRPPGHHADAATAMGFCLLNHAAVTAQVPVPGPRDSLRTSPLGRPGTYVAPSSLLYDTTTDSVSAGTSVPVKMIELIGSVY